MQTRTAPISYTSPDRQDLDRLLFSVAEGDQNALGDLYERTRGAVYGTALGVLGNAHDAQEITQDTFVQIWDTADRYRSQGSPMAWILTLARNLAISSLRKSSRSEGLSQEQWQAIPAEDKLTSAEDRAVLQDALALLDKDTREIVLLHAVSGLKHREIAGMLHMPLPTVLSKYHRALKKLKVQLEGV